jgi:hypothetical protein
MKSIFREADYHIRKSDKKPVWHNVMNWERLNMVKDGLLKSNSPRGIWELND